MPCDVCHSERRKLRVQTARIRICQICIGDSIRYRLLYLNRVLQFAPNVAALEKRYAAAQALGLITMWPMQTRPAGSELEEMTDYVLRRDHRSCVICSATILDGALHVHHIIPLLKGGTNDPRNLATLCIPCHQRQHPDFRISASGGTAEA